MQFDRGYISPTDSEKMIVEYENCKENQEILLALSQNSNSLEENTNEGRLSFEFVPHPGMMPTSTALRQPPDPTVLEDQNNSNQILVNVSPKVRPAKKIIRVRPDYTIVESVASSSNQSAITPIGKNKNFFGIQKHGPVTVIHSTGGGIYFNNGECSTSTSYSSEIHAELQNMKIQLESAREQNHKLTEEISKLKMEVNEIRQVMSFHINQINCNFAYSRDPRDPFGGGGSGAGMRFVAG